MSYEDVSWTELDRDLPYFEFCDDKTSVSVTTDV